MHDPKIRVVDARSEGHIGPKMSCSKDILIKALNILY